MDHKERRRSSLVTLRQLIFLVGLVALSLRLPSLIAAERTDEPLLRLSEVYYDTPGRDEEREWVELVYLGAASLDLSDYKLTDAPASGSREGAVRFPETAVIEPGAVVVVAQTATGFRSLFAQDPDFEITDTTAAVPDMRPYRLWARGEFALNNDGDEVLLLSPQNVIVDAVNYGAPTTLFRPTVADVVSGQSIERIPTGCDTDTAADWQVQRFPTPGRVTLDGECRMPSDPAAGLELLPIGAIQGSGDVSPYLHQRVSFRGVVTGRVADRNSRGITFHTLFVQDTPGTEDGDPLTSDGLAVFLATNRPHLAVGDRVLITGQVIEYFGLTEISHEGLDLVKLESPGALPEPILLDPHAHERENVEGMLVSLPEMRVVGPTSSTCTVVLVPADWPGTHVTTADANAPLLELLSVEERLCPTEMQLQVGTRLRGVSGPLTYHFDAYKPVQQDVAVLDKEVVPLPHPASVRTTPREIAVATFNLDNYFDSRRDTNNEGELLPTAAEVATKQAKLAAIIADRLGCPALLAIQEVEKVALLDALAERLAPLCGFRYQVTHRESPDARGIDLALMSDSRLIELNSATLHQACGSLTTDTVDPAATCPVGESPLFGRPPLLISLEIEGEKYAVIVNHFKSRREGSAETEPLRRAQAEHVAQLTRAFGTSARLIVLGDFNAEPGSTPLQTLEQAGLASALSRVPAVERYSYIFAGVAGLPDNIFLSHELESRLVSAGIVHLNADYPASMATDATQPYRASDHDVPFVVLRLPDLPVTPAPTSPATLPTLSPTAAATPQALAPVERPTGVAAWFPWLMGAGVLLGTGLLLGLAMRRR